MKKFIFNFIALFAFSFANAAVVADDAIYVWTSPTEYTCYLFSDVPTIEYDCNDLVISVANNEVQRISLSNVSNVEVTYGIKYPTVKLNSMGYATLSFKADMQLNSDCIKAYTAKVENGKIICSEIADGIIPAGNGVLLKGTASATTQLVAATSDVETLENNDLQATTLADGSLASVPELGYNFSLQGNLFYHYTGTSFIANKAYFNLSYNPVATSCSKLNISFDSEDDDFTTGVSALDNGKQNGDNCYYNINGQRVDNPTTGVYIVNGKKVLFK